MQGMIATILCLWMSIFLHFSLYNAGGGEGVRLPWNIVAWAIVVTIILGAGVMAPVGRTVVITPVSCLLFLAVLLLTLPVFWCPVGDWVIYSLPRLSGLWGGAVFYFVLLQCRFSHPVKRLFLWCVIFASFVQGCNVMAGLFRPSLLSPLSQMFLKTAGRGALGIFQQVNVTASFMATGFALSLALFYQEGIRHDIQKTSLLLPLVGRIKFVYLIVIMAFIPCVLVLTRSRTGWLGGITVYLVATATVLLTAYRQRNRSCYLPWKYTAAMVFTPLAGVMAGHFLLGCSVVEAISHSGSNYQRWLTLKVTWEMIRQRPLAGWGLGSFIMQFQHYIASHYSPNPSHEFMGHPHNEVLYVWMEGGIVALAGIMVLGCAIVTLCLKNRSPARRLMAMAMLPILLHTMLEYPLYLSSPHALILLLIALNLDRADKGCEMKPLRKSAELCLRGVAVVFCFWLLVCLQDAYRLNFMLSRFEAGDTSLSLRLDHTKVPWLLRSRYEDDRINLMLERYNRNGDLRLLHDVIKENARWLETHTDPDNYASQVEVLRYLHHEREACRYFQEGHLLFPHDERFNERTCI